MKKCSACGAKARKFVRATLLDGPGSMRRGFVCPSCAATGWLLVFAGERESKTHRNAVNKAAAKAFAALDPNERRTILELAGHQ